MRVVPKVMRFDLETLTRLAIKLAKGGICGVFGIKRFGES
jgi:hypothetical protein